MNPNQTKVTDELYQVATGKNHRGDRQIAFQELQAIDNQTILDRVLSEWNNQLSEEPAFALDAITLMSQSKEPLAAEYLVRRLCASPKRLARPIFEGIAGMGAAAVPALTAAWETTDPQTRPVTASFLALLLALVSDEAEQDAMLRKLESGLSEPVLLFQTACAKGLALLAGQPNQRGWSRWEAVSPQAVQQLIDLCDPRYNPRASLRALAAEALLVIAGQEAVPLALQRGEYVQSKWQDAMRSAPRPPLLAVSIPIPSPDPDPQVRAVWQYWYKLWEEDSVPIHTLPWFGMHLRHE